MNRLIPENLLHETINCIAKATHVFPYAAVNNLIQKLQELPRHIPETNQKEKVDEAKVENLT